MATISENLQTLKTSVSAIKQAISDKGGDVSGDISTWADAISGISGGSGGSGDTSYPILTGTKTHNTTMITYNGTLSNLPSNIQAAYLVAITYYMQLRSSYISVSNSTSSISITLDYYEPLSGTETPPLILLYKTSDMEYGNFNVVPVTFNPI